MAVAAFTVIQRAGKILKDDTGVRWGADELVRWLNDAQTELAIWRPDQVATIQTLALADGFRQSLPATAIKLIDIPNNSGGSRLAVRQIDRKDLDVIEPGWRASTPAAVIKHFIYDERTPRLFEVYPPALSATVDACVARYPAKVTEPAAGTDYGAVAGSIDVPDHWVSALVDFILYRAFSKDSELTVNAGRAQSHYQAFGNAIGVDLTAQTTVSPKPSRPGQAAS